MRAWERTGGAGRDMRKLLRKSRGIERSSDVQLEDVQKSYLNLSLRTESEGMFARLFNLPENKQKYHSCV